MVFKRSLNELMQKVWRQESVNVCSWKGMSERLNHINSLNLVKQGEATHNNIISKTIIVPYNTGVKNFNEEPTLMMAVKKSVRIVEFIG